MIASTLSHRAEACRRAVPGETVVAEVAAAFSCSAAPKPAPGLRAETEADERPSRDVLELGDRGAAGCSVLVEVLACRDLPVCDLLQQTSDPYALVVCESHVFATAVCVRTLAPTWGASDQRAVLVHASDHRAVISIGVLDHDRNDQHDGIGRLQLQCASLYSGTTDAWWPLQHEIFRRPGTEVSSELLVRAVARRTSPGQPHPTHRPAPPTLPRAAASSGSG